VTRTRESPKAKQRNRHHDCQNRPHSPHLPDWPDGHIPNDDDSQYPSIPTRRRLSSAPSGIAAKLSIACQNTYQTGVRLTIAEVINRSLQHGPSTHLTARAMAKAAEDVP
jgi:hypothetical protein